MMALQEAYQEHPSCIPHIFSGRKQSKTVGIHLRTATPKPHDFFSTLVKPPNSKVSETVKLYP